MQVKWLKKALANLESEAEYIAQSNPQSAQKIVQHIWDTVQLLANNPALGHAGRVHGTRELLIPDTLYLIPYRVRSEFERVEILRVFHTSRRPPQRW